MRRVLSAHQPAYLPWLGYFEKIARSDWFVFLDTVQFERNSFINRNRIKGAGGTQWLTIPVLQKGHLQSTLLATQIDDSQPWRDKHLRAIAQNYARAPDFRAKFARLEPLYRLETSNLADFCWAQLQFWLAELQIDTRLARSSQLPAMGRKSDLVLDLCRHFDADHYFSGALGRSYLREQDFAAAGIAIDYQSFAPVPYPQLHGEFEPGLAVLDWWMNCAGSGAGLPF
nr:WbqC family protein [Chromobacterium sp. ASV5]